MSKSLSKSKLSTPSKLVRRVLSWTSTSALRSSREESSKSSNNNKLHVDTTSETMKIKGDPENLELELTGLREQVNVLQSVLNGMQEDAEKREKILSNVANEKQQLAIDLKKEKRSSTNLKQQLSDEREFYFKEKEQYCQEMNDCKKLKKKMSESKKKEVCREDSAEIIACKSQISKLKTVLYQTLEVNRNLSVRFLKMRNTKINLKHRLRKEMSDHEQAMKNIQTTVNGIKEEIADIVDKRFQFPISPSNKKYLQIIKQNGTLIHENLCLKMEVNRLTHEINNLQYINDFIQARRQLKRSLSTQPQKTREKPSSSKSIAQKKSSEKKSMTKSKSKSKSKSSKSLEEAQSKSKKSSTTTTKPTSVEKASPDISTNLEKVKPILKNSTKDTEVIKIFERKKVEGVPHIIMLSETKKPNIDRSEKTNEDKKDNDKNHNDGSIEEHHFAVKDSEQELQLILPLLSQNSSAIGTESSTTSATAIRTQSAPEIVQTSSFVSNDKR